MLPGRLVCSADFQGIAAAVEREMVHISREIRGTMEDSEDLILIDIYIYVYTVCTWFDGHFFSYSWDDYCKC